MEPRAVGVQRGGGGGDGGGVTLAGRRSDSFHSFFMLHRRRTTIYVILEIGCETVIKWGKFGASCTPGRREPGILTAGLVRHSTLAFGGWSWRVCRRAGHRGGHCPARPLARSPIVSEDPRRAPRTLPPWPPCSTTSRRSRRCAPRSPPRARLGAFFSASGSSWWREARTPLSRRLGGGRRGPICAPPGASRGFADASRVPPRLPRGVPPARGLRRRAVGPTDPASAPWLRRRRPPLRPRCGQPTSADTPSPRGSSSRLGGS